MKCHICGTDNENSSCAHYEKSRGGSRPGSGQPKKIETTTFTVRVPVKAEEGLKEEFKMIAFCHYLIEELGATTINGRAAIIACNQKKHKEIIQMFGDQAFRDAPESMAKILSPGTIKKLKHFYESI